MVVGNRRYEELWLQRTNARVEFRARNPRRNARRMIPYPTELEALPPFGEWFRTDIETTKQAGISIPEDVEDSSNLPSLQAQRFESMYAYGYHYRVKSAEESITKTCDSGVAAFFRRPCRSGRRDANVVDANLEYIGQILEIVELNYGRHCTVLLVCDWVKANYNFPIHCDQVFFSDVEDEPGWRVVLRTEVRGRRIDNNIEDEDVNPMFEMGADVDFEGLRAPDVIPETPPDPLPTGRNIRLNDILNEVLGEQALVFDRDVGESSEEGE